MFAVIWKVLWGIAKPVVCVLSFVLFLRLVAYFIKSHRGF